MSITTFRALCLGLLVLFSSLSLAEVVPVDRIVAVVDDDVIMQSELDQKTREVLFRLEQNKTATPPEAILRQQVLDKLIVESIQIQKAEKGGIRVSQNELEEAVSAIAAQNRMTTREFLDYAASNGLSPDSIIEGIRRDIILQQLQRIMIDRKIDITDREIDDFLLSEEGKMRASDNYRLAHIILPVNDSMGNAEIAELQALAESISTRANNGEDFRSLAVTHSRAPDALEGGEIGWRKKSQMPSLYAERVDNLQTGQTSAPFRSNAGIHIISLLDKQGFSEEKLIGLTKVRHILLKPTAIRNEQEVIDLLSDIRKRLSQGEAFADLAKTYTDDIGTALNGGDLGWVPPGQMVAEFESVMNTTPAGNTSEPFRTQFGWHILLVEDRKQQDVGEDMLRNQAKNFLYSRKFEEQLAHWQNELRNDAYIDIK